MFFSERVPPEARNAYKKDAVAGMLGAVMMGLTMPFIAVIARKTLKASALELSVITMAPLAGSLLSILWANAMEGRRKMPFVFWSWIASRSLFFLAVFATNSLLFVAMFAVYCLVISVNSPAYSAILKEIYPDGDRGRIMGYARVCTVSVMIAMTAIAGPLLHAVSYRWVFPFAALFGLAAACTFRRIPAKEATGDRNTPVPEFFLRSVAILREDRGFAWFCAGIFVSGWGNLMALPVFVLYQVDVLHVNEVWASAYSVVVQLVAMVGYVYWGSYIDRKTPNKAVAANVLIWTIVPLAYCFATSAWMLLPVMVLNGIVNSGLELAYLNGIYQHAPDDRITHYQAVFSSLGGLRGIMAPLLGAYLVDSGLLSMKGVFIISAVMILSSYVIQVIGIRKYPAAS